MFRLFCAILVIALVFMLWDRGTLRGTFSQLPSRSDGSRMGPAETVGAAVDRGLAKTGEAIERAGRKLEHAADRSTRTAQRPRETP